MKNIVGYIGAVVLGAGAIVPATSAAAADTVIVTAPAPSARVSYADLDLGSQAGRAQLQQRIRGAAGSLCFEDNVNPLDVRLLRHACFTAAVADGYRQVDELVTARGSGTAVAASALTIVAR